METVHLHQLRVGCRGVAAQHALALRAAHVRRHRRRQPVRLGSAASLALALTKQRVQRLRIDAALVFPHAKVLGDELSLHGLVSVAEDAPTVERFEENLAVGVQRRLVFGRCLGGVPYGDDLGALRHRQRRRNLGGRRRRRRKRRLWQRLRHCRRHRRNRWRRRRHSDARETLRHCAPLGRDAGQARLETARRRTVLHIGPRLDSRRRHQFLLLAA
mmetsp:Transcript_7721/g.23578  ORF Transcript_7721/g.23578 Transcript_7721/m.23578 type:complete len:216 (+) Transcript_7721:2571-3218(+)